MVTAALTSADVTSALTRGDVKKHALAACKMYLVAGGLLAPTRQLCAGFRPLSEAVIHSDMLDIKHMST